MDSSPLKWRQRGERGDNMGKLLVEYDNVKQYISHDEKKFYVDPNMILTPGAKDYLSQAGVSIVYAARPDQGKTGAPKSRTDQSRELISRVVTILKNDYGIVDEQKLCNITTQVFKKLQLK
jgi:hypothetical protein